MTDRQVLNGPVVDPPTDPSAPAVRLAEPLASRWSSREILRRYTVVFTLVALVVVFSATRPSTFFTVGDLQTILATQAPLLVLTLLLTVTLATGELDLSVGGQLAFSAVLVGELTGVHHLGTGTALLISLAASLAVGLFNGLLIVRMRVNGFIVTLAMGTLLVGLADAVSGSTTVGGIPAALRAPFADSFLGVGLPFWYALAIAIVLWYVLAHTPSGRRVYFTGEGREAARLAGVREARIRIIAFVLAALGGWLAGVIVLGQTGAAQSSIGMPYLLPAYAAAFLGAATITPGRFNIGGTVVATYLLAVGTTGLQLFGLATWVTEVFDGGILIAAVTFAAAVGVRES